MRNSTDTPGDNSLDYVERVNRAIDYIIQNLDQVLKLEDVAKVAFFSPFHFHRVFRSILGETLNQFVKRLRLERALSLLSRDRDKSLTELAFACGFASSSDFSRSFKQRYGVPPSIFDIDVFRTQRREELQDAITDPKERHLLDRLPDGQNPDGFVVEIRDMPARTVAYIRVINSYRPGAVTGAAERMVVWAEGRGLADGQWLGYMWDDPDIVAHELCRYDVGLEVSSARPDGEIGCLDFPSMQVAQLEVRGPIDLEMRAIDWLFGTWLPDSGYLPTEHPCFEAWIGRPFAHGFEYFELHLQLPVAR